MTAGHTPEDGTPTLLSAAATLAIAARASRRSGEFTDDPLIASLFSAIAVESWVNEFLYHVRVARADLLVSPLDRLQPLISAARLEERSTSIAVRLDVIGAVLQGSAWTRGRQPFQDLDLLLDIRNTLVHQRPETTPIDIYETRDGSLISLQSQHSPLAERLFARKIVRRPDPRVLTSLLVVLQMPEVGRWSFATACAVISAMASRLPGNAWRYKTTFGLAEFLEASRRLGEQPNHGL